MVRPTDRPVDSVASHGCCGWSATHTQPHRADSSCSVLWALSQRGFSVEPPQVVSAPAVQEASPQVGRPLQTGESHHKYSFHSTLQAPEMEKGKLQSRWRDSDFTNLKRELNFCKVTKI